MSDPVCCKSSTSTQLRAPCSRLRFYGAEEPRSRLPQAGARAFLRHASSKRVCSKPTSTLRAKLVNLSRFRTQVARHVTEASCDKKGKAPEGALFTETRMPVGTHLIWRNFKCPLSQYPHGFAWESGPVRVECPAAHVCVPVSGKILDLDQSIQMILIWLTCLLCFPDSIVRRELQCPVLVHNIILFHHALHPELLQLSLNIRPGAVFGLVPSSGGLVRKAFVREIPRKSLGGILILTFVTRSVTSFSSVAVPRTWFHFPQPFNSKRCRQKPCLPAPQISSRSRRGRRSTCRTAHSKFFHVLFAQIM